MNTWCFLLYSCIKPTNSVAKRVELLKYNVVVKRLIYLHKTQSLYRSRRKKIIQLYYCSMKLVFVVMSTLMTLN